MTVELGRALPVRRARTPSAALVTGLLCLGLALGFRYLLNQAIGNAVPFVTVFGATAAAQWFAGRQASIPVALLGLVGCVLMLTPVEGHSRVAEVGGVLGIAAFVFTSALIIGFGEAARAAQVAAQRRGETLRVTLQSIGDAVITTDTAGRVRSLNAVAESLTGWLEADAAGQPLDAVFRIVNEDTRRPVENPATKALREGTIVGLANHTILIGRDGAEHPIDDSAAPIRDARGRVSGCVLVFRDVGAQRQVEHERASQLQTARLHSAVLKNSQDFIGMCDLQGVPFFVNDAGLALVGLDSLEQARQKPVADFFFPEDQARIVGEFFPRVLREGQGEIEVRFRHFKTGAARWMAYKVLTLTDHTGAAVGFATVSQDVTERKAHADELIEADRRKNEFLAMLAHELRNPLAPLSNAVLAIQRREPGDEETVTAATEILERQIRQMSRLVNDLLDASRISRGRIELRRSRIALGPVVEEAIETVRPLLTRLEHTLTTTIPAEPIHVDGDAGRLAQVVGNLLTNAAKFTDKGGEIRLTVAREGEEAVIRVRDNGIGIAPESMESLFELFVQADASIERSRDGLGIGLTLVKRLAELHGGSIQAHSDGPGRGAEFTVRLPAQPAGVASQAVVVPVPAAADAAGRRVLVVDDNHDGAQSLAMLLEFEGHEVHQAHDGADAITKAERMRPDVVLMDIGLPVLNGYEACQRIRSHGWGAGLTMVAITGWGQEDDRERSRVAGFDLHLVKPVDHAELLRVVASARPRASA